MCYLEDSPSMKVIMNLPTFQAQCRHAQHDTLIDYSIMLVPGSRKIGYLMRPWLVLNDARRVHTIIHMPWYCWTWLSSEALQYNVVTSAVAAPFLHYATDMHAAQCTAMPVHCSKYFEVHLMQQLVHTGQ